MGAIAAGVIGLVIVAFIVFVIVKTVLDLFARPAFNERVIPRVVCRDPKCVIEISHQPRDLDSWSVSLGPSWDGPWTTIASSDGSSSSDINVSRDGERRIYQLTADNSRLADSDEWTVRFHGTRNAWVGDTAIEPKHTFRMHPAGTNTVTLPGVREEVPEQGQPFVERIVALSAAEKGDLTFCPGTSVSAIGLGTMLVIGERARILNEIPGGEWEGLLDPSRVHPLKVHLWLTSGESDEQDLGVFDPDTPIPLSPSAGLDAGVTLRGRMESGDQGDFQFGFVVSWEWSADITCSPE